MTDTCSLTKTKGAFVRSHLIPKALSRPSQPGAPFVESSSGVRPIRRWDSWYDNNLVTRDGEDILSAFDDAGITELRKHGVLWSGRHSLTAAPTPDFFDEESGVGARIISGVDTHAVRMFFLSLLWRCAASKRREVKAIALSESKLEQLRLMLVEDRHTPNATYPFTLTQLLEVGFIHNLAPLEMTMPLVNVNGQESKSLRVFRFYMDGLIANIIKDDSGYGEGMPFNEQERKMIVLTVRTESSFEIMNLAKHAIETEAKWPNVMTKNQKAENKRK